MTESPAYAVTGATGGLGGRVAARLAARGLSQRLLVRDTARAPDLPGAEVASATYADAESMRRALDGIRTLLLVSASEARDRVDQHLTAVDAAVAAGVERIVYVSFLGAAPEATFTFARDHWHTEEHIRSTGLAFTVQRSSLYLDVLPAFAGADGVIRGPAGEGWVGAVARDDVADVAVALLTDAGHDGRIYDVTGPRPFTLDELAAELSRVSGRLVTYQRETLEEARASRAGFGAPAWEIEGWVTSYAAIATGELAAVTDVVAHLTGHPPRDLTDFLAAHPESYRHLVAGTPSATLEG